MKNIVFIFIFLLVSLSLNAQDKRVYEGTLSYILHSTQKGETIYSLTRTYSVSQELLLRYNPFLSQGLKVGQQIKIPASGEVKFSDVKGNVTYSFYRAGNNETLKKIAGYFSLDESELMDCNPGVSQGTLSVNQIVRIPNIKIVKSSNFQKKNRSAEYNTLSHQVVRKETLYSISKKYDCSVSDILKLNPMVKNRKRLRKGTILKIPILVVSENEQKENEVVLPDIRKNHDSNLYETSDLNYGKYLIKRGETLYSISKKFFVSVNELITANPDIKMDDLVPGEMILIPKNNLNKNMFTHQVYENLQPSNNLKMFSGHDPDAAFKTYKVGLMIPLFLSENKKLNSEVKVDSVSENILIPDDSLVSVIPSDSAEIKKKFKIYSGSKSFLNFYEGVLLAVDSLKNAGMKIELYTFDTEKKDKVVDSLMNNGIFKSLDLIIGPVFPDLQRNVAAFARENHIPFVSPLSSSGDIGNNNPYYFKVNPEKAYFIQKTGEYMTRECMGKNIVFLEMGEYKHLQEASLIDKLRAKYGDHFYDYAKEEQPDFHEYMYSSYGLDGLREIMKKDKENVIFIPSVSEGQQSVAITNLNTLTKEGFPVKLIGLPDYQRYKSIQTEYLYNTNLNYLNSYFIDYKSPSVNNFIRKFRDNFFAEPDNFSFQGYDVAFYFMNALKNYGRYFIADLPLLKVKLLQNNFIFQKQSEFGGYVNEGLFVVKYSPDYMEFGKPYVDN